MDAHKRRPNEETFGDRDDHGFGQITEELYEYFAGHRTTFAIAIAATGNSFQHLVWNALREIPYGETWSYGHLALYIGKPGAARAVGSINGQNPISIVVPCHRVIGANGLLVGYGGGIDRKAFLLDLEKARVEPTLFS
jgi:methylated-DNA-[protein]-cysteine S-methyltransferase